MLLLIYLFSINTFLFSRHGTRMLFYVFVFLFSQRVKLGNREESTIRSKLNSSLPIRFQILHMSLSKYFMPFSLISEIIHPRSLIFNDAKPS